MKTPIRSSVIKTAIIVPKRILEASRLSLVVDLSIETAIFETVQACADAGYFDVILLHESLIKLFDKARFKNSELIILVDPNTDITITYRQVKAFDPYTIIPFTSEPKVIIQNILRAYDAFISHKQEESEQIHEGKIIHVGSFANGVGKSTVAYNVAAKLSRLFPENSICLVDCNQPFGIAKAMLNIDTKYSWSTIRAVLNGDKVTQQKITNILYATPYGFSLLAGPTDYEQNEPLTSSQESNLCSILKQYFKIVILDRATYTSTSDLERSRESDLNLVLTDTSAISILNTATAFNNIIEARPDIQDKTKLVVTKVDESLGRTTQLVGTKLQKDVFAGIDEDSEAVRTFNDSGRLINDKTLLLNAQFAELAEKLLKLLF